MLCTEWLPRKTNKNKNLKEKMQYFSFDAFEDGPNTPAYWKMDMFLSLIVFFEMI